MARLTLIFAGLTFIVLAIQFGVKGQIPDADSDARSVNEDSSDRGASASTKAFAQNGIYARPGPAPPGPYPVPPGPYPGPPGPGPQKVVECLACSGCPDARNVTTKSCPYSSDPLRNRKCVVYSEKYHHMKDPWTVRGCASERGTCTDIKAALSHQSDLVKLASCRDCEGDRCNSAGYSTPDLLAALITMVITPLLMKHTLS